MKSVGLVVHHGKPRASITASELAGIGRRRGVEVEEAAEGRAYDLVVALGGDGTMLRAAALAAPMGAPLLGVNLGRFGYLASVGPDSITGAMDRVLDGSCKTESRMLIEAVATGGDGVQPRVVALNEVVVERDQPSRVIRLRVGVDGQEIADYTVDGFIVATPTGSTAYSLSAGGPIVEPAMQAITLTPVSPHWPLWRSVVVDPGRTVELLMVEGGAVLAADGQAAGGLGPGHLVEVRRHQESLELLVPEPFDFFQRIRERFHMEPRLGERG